MAHDPHWIVQIGSRSFGGVYPEHIRQLEEAGCEVRPNTVGRAYRASELMDALRDADAIITGTDELTADVIAAAPKLKTIAKHGIGLETIDLDAARARGIVVSATPQAVTDAVADLTLALLLAAARKIVSGAQQPSAPASGPTSPACNCAARCWASSVWAASGNRCGCAPAASA